MRVLVITHVCALVVACCQSTHAATIVQRDTIGGCDANGNNCTPTLTNGMPGATAFIARGQPDAINSPGASFIATDSGILSEAKFVIFASQDSFPVNDPAFFDTFQLTFNLWNDGVQNGTDSFANNPGGDAGNGHIVHEVNDTVGGLDIASIEVFGQTGPPGNQSLFTTYLVTLDLTSFQIPIDAGREYVFNIIQDLDRSQQDPGNFRLVGSTFQDGIEDLWFTSDTPNVLPGFVQSQQAAIFQRYGTFLSINNDSADFDTDDDVDGHDFLAWQRGFGTMGGATKAQGDANDDFDIDAADLAVWETQFGNVTSPLSASTTVPEPTTAVLLSMSVVLLGMRRRPRC